MIDNRAVFFTSTLYSLCSFTVCDTPMLQDLDQLANRISRLASYSDRLKTERSELLARVKLLEQERTTLRDQLSSQQAEYASMAEIVTRHQQEMAMAKQVAEESQEALYAELIQQQEELTLLKKDLQTSHRKAASLEHAAIQARDQVNDILQRLPGGDAAQPVSASAQD